MKYFISKTIPAFMLLLLLAPAKGRTEDQPVPPEGCVVVLDVPEGTRVTVDGRDYGMKRRLEFPSVLPLYGHSSLLHLHYSNGTVEERRILLDRGKTIYFSRPGFRLPEVMEQSGHSSPITDAVFTNDNRYLFTFSEGSTVLWNAESGRQMRSYTGNGNGKPSPSGATFITDSKVLDKSTGKALFALSIVGERGKPVATNDFIWSKDGSTVVALFEQFEGENSIAMFDARDGRRIISRSLASWPKGLVLSPDGTQLAFQVASAGTPRSPSDRDRTTLHVVDAKTLESVKQFTTFRGRPIAFNPDGKKLIVAESIFASDFLRHELNVYDLQRVEKTGHFGRDFVATKFSTDGRVAARRVKSGIEIYDAADFFSGRQPVIQRVLLDADQGDSIFLSHDGKYLFDGKLNWNCSTGTKLHGLVNNKHFASDIAVFPDGRRVKISEGDQSNAQSASIYDLLTLKRLRHFTPPTDHGRFDTAALSDDGSTIAVISQGGISQSQNDQVTITSFDADRGEKKYQTVVDNSIHSIGYSKSLSTDGNRIAIQQLMNFSIWDLPTGRRLFHAQSTEENANENRVMNFVISPDGRLAFTQRRISTLTSVADSFALVDIATVREFKRLEKAYLGRWDARFSPDGRYVAGIGSSDVEGRAHSLLLLWSVENGALTHRIENRHLVDKFAFSGDGRFALCYDSKKLGGEATLWDIEAERALRTIRLSHGWESAAIMPDNHTIVATSSSGCIHLLDIPTGDETVRVILLKDQQNQLASAPVKSTVNPASDWLAITPAGIFDGTERGRQQILFRVGDGLDVVPVDRFFQDYYRPGLLAEILRGERPLPGGEFADQAAPLIKVLSPALDTTVEQPKVTIEAEITDRGGGISGPWLMQNGSRIAAQGERKTEGKSVRQTFTVALIEGENRFEIRAASSDGSWESEPGVLVVKYAQPIAKPAVHLVSVGVNSYKHESMNLKFAAPDATAMATLFQQRGPELYGQDQVHVTQVLDDQATREGIEKALGEVAKSANPQDTLVVFLAGHGTTLGQRYYFIPHEFQAKAEKLDDDIRNQGIAGDVLGDWVEKVPALKRILIFDTCQSGGALPVSRTARDPFAFRGALERLSHARGFYTIAAAAASETAQEVPELKHGMLTYALLAGAGVIEEGPLANQGIKATNEDKVVEVREWFGFAQDKVPLLTKLYLGQEQFIGFTGQGTSFPVLPAK